MKHPLQSASAFFNDSPAQLRRSVALALLALVVLVLFALAAGCATTPTGIAREEAIYGWATNAVAQARQVVPYIPAPASNIVEVSLGVAAALLAAWNTAQHRAIQKLKNGNGAVANTPAGTRPQTTGS
jgi:hypothetical protein